MKKLWQRFKAGWTAWWIAPDPRDEDLSQLDEWHGVGGRRSKLCPECGSGLDNHGTVARCRRCGWKHDTRL
jgi:hypothetical protein